MAVGAVTDPIVPMTSVKMEGGGRKHKPSGAYGDDDVITIELDDEDLEEDPDFLRAKQESLRMAHRQQMAAQQQSASTSGASILSSAMAAADLAAEYEEHMLNYGSDSNEEESDDPDWAPDGSSSRKRSKDKSHTYSPAAHSTLQNPPMMASVPQNQQVYEAPEFMEDYEEDEPEWEPPASGSTKKKIRSGKFQCNLCGKETRKKNDHASSHLNLKPYKCPLCNRRDNFKNNITAHLKKEHNAGSEMNRQMITMVDMKDYSNKVKAQVTLCFD